MRAKGFGTILRRARPKGRPGAGSPTCCPSARRHGCQPKRIELGSRRTAMPRVDSFELPPRPPFGAWRGNRRLVSPALDRCPFEVGPRREIDRLVQQLLTFHEARRLLNPKGIRRTSIAAHAPNQEHRSAPNPSASSRRVAATSAAISGLRPCLTLTTSPPVRAAGEPRRGAGCFMRLIAALDEIVRAERREVRRVLGPDQANCAAGRRASPARGAARRRAL